MDKRIEKKRNLVPKIFLSVCGLTFVAYISFAMITKEKQANLQKDRLTIKTVQHDYFEDMVLFQGEVEPLNTVLINTIESGAVREIFVEDGAIVKRGEALVEIYNPNAEFNYLTQETAIIEQINNLSNIRISIKNQQFDLDKSALEIQHNFNNEQREFTLNEQLYDAKILAKNEFEKSKEAFRFQTAQQDMVRKNIDNEKSDRQIQMERINASIAKMEKSLKKLRANKQNFIVKASAAGKVSSFNPVIGQSFQGGDALGKIDLLDGYKMTARVDEFYNSKILLGQEAQINVDGQEYEMEVSKVLSEVVNGQFNVELKFKNEAPKDIKRGMNLPIKIFLSNKNKKALLLAKGGFYQSSGGQYVYVLTNENQAEKRFITIGKTNPYYYEVLDGLKADDQVITSSYENYKAMTILNLK